MQKQLDLLDRVPLRGPVVMADAQAVGERMAQACEEKAERVADFDGAGAGRFIVGWLRRYGPTSGEALVNAAIEHGFRPHDQRAYGGVFSRLSKAKEIRAVGYCLREKGHATGGGRIWSAA